MARKPKNVPNSATGRSAGKNVVLKEAPRDDSPVWRFSTTDLNGPFPWPKTKSEELSIVEKLHQFDSMTWKSIEGKAHHFLSQSSISKEAIKRLEDIHRDDEIDNLFSFHLSGKERIIAVRHGNVAKLLWYDPQHSVAPSTLKHT
jgi:hypothetical protein